MRVILLLLFSMNATANGFYVFGGIEAFDDKLIRPEHNIQSPNGVFGVFYRHNVTNRFNLKVGVEHESSIPTREMGTGFNSFIFHGELKLD